MSVVAHWSGYVEFHEFSRETLKASPLAAQLARGDEVTAQRSRRDYSEATNKDLASKPYDGPVGPSLDTDWADHWRAAQSTSSHEWNAGFNYGVEILGFWLEFQCELFARGNPGSMMTFSKSNLLGRLVRGEEIRLRPCPKHEGSRGHGYGPADPEYACCQKTGWLPNDADDVARLQAAKQTEAAKQQKEAYERFLAERNRTTSSDGL